MRKQLHQNLSLFAALLGKSRNGNGSTSVPGDLPGGNYLCREKLHCCCRVIGFRVAGFLLVIVAHQCDGVP